MNAYFERIILIPSFRMSVSNDNRTTKWVYCHDRSKNRLSVSRLAHVHVAVAATSAAQRLLCRLPPLQALVHPLCDTVLAAGAYAVARHALEHLAREADKVVPAQSVFEAPLATLALLALQQLIVAKLPRPHAQVPTHGEQVEANLSRLVAGDAALQHLDHLGGELVLRAGAVRNGRGLQAVELVQRAVDGRVGDEVEGVLGLGIGVALRLVGKRVAAREAVVHLADEVRVAQRLAAELGRQHHGELTKVAQLLANVDRGAVSGRRPFAGLVQQYAEQRLRGACVLYRLRGEEELLRGRLVKGAIEGAIGCGVGFVGRVFEEEDDAVDGL